MTCTYEDIVSICDAHGIGLPVDCVEMVMAIVDLAAARAPTLPDQAGEPDVTPMLLEAIAKNRGLREGEIWKFDDVGLSLFINDIARLYAAPPANAPVAMTDDAQLFREALAWGKVYGAHIPASQWDEMRDTQAAKFAERALAFMGREKSQSAFDKAHPDCSDCGGTTCNMNCSGKENV